MYLTWFKSYLSGRTQYIQYDNSKTEMANISCGVPQGSILGPLLFLIYVNDLKSSSKILNPIMFADDTNLFYSHKNIKSLFDMMNKELKHISEWFRANKLSLNASKMRYTFFHKLQIADDIPLQLPPLWINNILIKREYSLKFLGVILDENLSWKSHIKLLENKIAKNVGILYKAKFILNQKCLKSIYYAFIPSYINYANIAWGSTHQLNSENCT